MLLRVRFAEVSRSAMTELGVVLFTSPTGIKNTLGRATTQQFAAPGFDDLKWTKANSDFGSDVTSAEGKFTFSDFLNLFLFSEKYDIGAVMKALQTQGPVPEPGRAEPGRGERQGSELPRRRRVPDSDRAGLGRQHGHHACSSRNSASA